MVLDLAENIKPKREFNFKSPYVTLQGELRWLYADTMKELSNECQVVKYTKIVQTVPKHIVPRIRKYLKRFKPNLITNKHK